MAFLLAIALALFRFTGFFFEPMLSRDQIHAVTGEPARVMWTLSPDRPLSVVTWNIERGVRFDRVADVLDELDADVILLQEVDRFCDRSGNRDVASELAETLRMNFTVAGEFQEIGEGGRGRACVSGQAILSRLPIEDAATIRFEEQASLKWRWNPAQPRRGGRIALRARIAGTTYYSVHLESGSDERLRAKQVGDIVDDARLHTGKAESGARHQDQHRGVIIGGDFNNEGDARSAMFAGLRAAGFQNAATGSGVARRPIDWIFTRGVAAAARVIRAPDASDHDPVKAEVLVQRRF